MDQKIVTYYMSSEDASDYLNEMTQSNSNPGGPGSGEFRVQAISLEKVVNQIRTHKQSRKLGRYEIDIIYRIQVTNRKQSIFFMHLDISLWKIHEKNILTCCVRSQYAYVNTILIF